MKKNFWTKIYKVDNWSKMFIIFFLLSNILVGCVGDDVVPVTPKPEPVVEPTLTVSLTPSDSVAYKDSLVLQWTSSNLQTLQLNDKVYDAIWSVTANGVKQPSVKEGKITYKNVMTDQIFKFRGVAKNGKTIEKEYKVPVGVNPNALRDDSLCLNIYWKTDSIIALNDGTGVWDKLTLSEIELSQRWFYYFDGKYKAFYPDGSLAAGGFWEWYGKDAIKYNNSDKNIVKYTFTDKNHLIESRRNGTILTYLTGYYTSTPQ